MPIVHNGCCLFDRRSHLTIPFAEPVVKQRRECGLAQFLFFRFFENLLPFLRNVEFGLEQRQRFRAQPETQIARVLQDFEDGQTIFERTREVRCVEGIAKNVRVPELPSNSRRRIVRLLISRRRKPYLDEVVELLSERVRRLRQNIRHTARRNLNVEVLQELADLRLAHVAAILQ